MKNKGITQMSSEMNKSELNDDIAVVGLGGRFPGATSVDEFWSNLCEGKETISFFTDEELLAAGIPSEVVNDPAYVKASPVLADIDKFDAKFFQYSPREAQALDPQQRVFLETAWATLEDGGYTQATDELSIGVFAGSGGVVTSYLLAYLDQHPEIRGMTGGFQHLANDKDFMATRVSYKLDLKGPSINVQTACSSSLVAVHMACQSILNGECHMALAGGVNIRVPHQAGYFRQEGDIFSPDGHCRAFDAHADGIVFGSGIGVVLLKPLSDAIRDNDLIYAVIKSSAINNDGGKKISYTASSQVGQKRCMLDAFRVAGIDPCSIGYIEAHGTGTAMGDPVEVSALTEVFRTQTDKTQFCGIGSVKSNVGHLDTASGITSFIKTVLCLFHKKIPPSINFKTPNPKIDFKNSPFYVVRNLSDWPSCSTPRRAGVNSLGIGGTNAFVLLEEAPEPKIKTPSEIDDQYYVIAVSAKSQFALNQRVEDLRSHLDCSHGLINLRDISYTLMCRKTHFRHRYALVVNSIGELKHRLAAYDYTASTAVIELEDVDINNEIHDIVTKKLNPSIVAAKLAIISHHFMAGQLVNWSLLFDDLRAPSMLRLPTYPFERQSYWVGQNGVYRHAVNQKTNSSIERWWGCERLRSVCFNDELVFETTLSSTFYPFLSDHAFVGQTMVAGSALISLLLGVVDSHLPKGQYAIENVQFTEAFMLPENEQRKVQIVLRPKGINAYSFKIAYLEDDDIDQSTWRVPLTGEIVSFCEDEPKAIAIANELVNLETTEFYARLGRRGLEMGPSYQCISEPQYFNGQAKARLVNKRGEMFARGFHPGNFDALFQLMQLITPVDEAHDQIALLVGWERLYCSGQCPDEGEYLVSLREDSLQGTFVVGDVALCDKEGRCVVRVEGVRLQISTRDRIPTFEPARFTRWKHVFDWADLPTTPERKEVQSNGTWVVFSDGTALTDNLSEKLSASGAKVVRVAASEWMTDREHYGLISNNAQSFIDVINGVRKMDSLNGVIFLWGMRCQLPRNTNSESLSKDQLLICQGLLHTIQAISKIAVNLWLVTQGAVSLKSEQEELNPFQGSLWGIGRTLVMERPQASCYLLDMDPASPVNADIVFDEIICSGYENQLAIRGDQRYGIRLRRMSDIAHAKTRKQLRTAEKQSYEMAFSSTGNLSSLEIRESIAVPPEIDQVEIEVEFVGLGFRDVLVGRGLINDNKSLGDDGVGIIRRIGAGVSNYSVGDRVMFISPDCWRSHKTLSTDLICPVSEVLSNEQAATIPMAYLTAYYALIYLAKLKRGDIVLIHSAASGVGLAALNLARAIGATVYATVGSQEKKAYLKFLGVEHILNSRDENFSAALSTLVRSVGSVDVVLNSLTGTPAELSYSVLGKGGRFLDLTRLLSKKCDNVNAVTYYAIDLYQFIAQHQSVVQQILQKLVVMLDEEKIVSLPVHSSAVGNAIDALESFARGGHIGKRLLALKKDSHATIRDDGTYLVIGGFGALGPFLLDWLVAEGAKYIVLADFVPPSNDIVTRTNELNALGVDVILEQVNVSAFDDVTSLFNRIGKRMPVIRGIFHGAAMIQDEPMSSQSWSDFQKILPPKIEGSWNLHICCQGLPLDHFVMFSSIASVMGSANQGSYAAANAYQDALAHYRFQKGMPALSINWSPWTVGIGAAMGERAAEVWRSWGSNTLNPGKDVPILRSLLTARQPQIAVLSIDWPTFIRQYTQCPPFLTMLASKSEEKIVGKLDHSVLETELYALPNDEQREYLSAYLKKHLSKTLGLPVSNILEQSAFAELGLDSLLAVELRNTIQRDVTRHELPAMIVFSYPTVESLSAHLAALYEYAPKMEATDIEAIVENVPNDNAEKLSVADLEAMLDFELNNV